MGYENIAWQIGDEGDYARGYDHIWSLKNGIVMSSQLEQDFDAGVFVIVPIETPERQPQRLQLLLVNMDKVDQPIDELEGRTYGDIDQRELVFKSDGRPGLRYLYWHYVTTILRALTYGDKAEITQRFPGKKMWPSSGSYFRRSMLKPLAEAIGDYEVSPEDFEEGLWEGKGRLPEALEVLNAADTAIVLDEKVLEEEAGGDLAPEDDDDDDEDDDDEEEE